MSTGFFFIAHIFSYFTPFFLSLLTLPPTDIPFTLLIQYITFISFPTLRLFLFAEKLYIM